MKYVLDPMVFALKHTMSEHEFRIYVTRIIQWEKWVEKNPEDVYVLSDTSYILGSMNAFPIYQTFEELVKKFKVDYVQASTLNRAINGIITKSMKIDRIGMHKADSDFDLVDCTFDNGKNVFESDVEQDSFKKILWYVYCHCHHDSLDPETFIVFGNNLKDNVSFDVEYTTIENVDGKFSEVTITDNANVHCKSSLADFFKSDSTPTDILTKEEDERALSLAIRVAVYQKGNLKRVLDSFDNYDFRIQTSFLNDYQSNHYRSQPSFLNSFVDAMSHSLLNMNIRDREDFRTGIGGNNPQKKMNKSEGTWLAWRWKVTSSVSFQYWMLKGKYRFADIGEHDYYVCKWEE